MNILDKLKRRVGAVNSLVCVGLDSDVALMPERFRRLKQPQFEFNKWVIKLTHEYVCAFKPNLAFYEARGVKGWRELRLTMEYLREEYPEIVTIADAKRADIGSTNEGYVKAIFDDMGFDAVTLHPWLGQEALAPFLEREDKGCIVLCRTSNPGAGEVQDLEVVRSGDIPRAQLDHGITKVSLWEVVAEKVAGEWNERGNCMLVMGATYPEELKRVRQIVGKMPILVPGVGAQGGSVAEVMEAGLDEKREGLIINSSRGVIYSSDPKKETKRLRDEINGYRSI